MVFVRRAINYSRCWYCEGSGQTISSLDSELYSDCGLCNAKGYTYTEVDLIMTDKSCHCKNGSLFQEVSEHYKYYSIMGFTYRRLVPARLKYLRKCEDCFGTGKVHYLPLKVEHDGCQHCDGTGKLVQTEWVKGLFGMEQKKQQVVLCNVCYGKNLKRVEWVIGEKYRDQLYLGVKFKNEVECYGTLKDRFPFER